MISAAILAGGLSRRMGQDKACLPLAGKPMVLIVAGMLKRVTRSEPVLVVKSPKKYEHLGIPCIRDLMPHRCALSGIDAALKHAKTSRVLIASCDSPFLSAKLLMQMIRTPGDVVVCEVDKQLKPFPGIYSVALLDHLPDSFAEGVLSVQENMFACGFPSILDEHTVRSLDPDLKSFRNINSPEDIPRPLFTARKTAMK